MRYCRNSQDDLLEKYPGIQFGGFFIAYDCTRRHSLDSVHRYFQLVNGKMNQCGHTVPVVLVATKADMVGSSRRVSTEEGRIMAERYGVPFFETSAKTGFNVDEAFDGLLHQSLRMMKQQGLLEESEEDCVDRKHILGGGGGMKDDNNETICLLEPQKKAKRRKYCCV